MLIKVTPRNAIPSSEITDESVYRNRRQFLREAGLLGVAAATVAAPKVAEAMEAFWKIYCDVKQKVRVGVDPMAATRKPYESPF